jgi:hypothetical protein
VRAASAGQIRVNRHGQAIFDSDAEFTAFLEHILRSVINNMSETDPEVLRDVQRPGDQPRRGRERRCLHIGGIGGDRAIARVWVIAVYAFQPLSPGFPVITGTISMEAGPAHPDDNRGGQQETTEVGAALKPGRGGNRLRRDFFALQLGVSLVCVCIQLFSPIQATLTFVTAEVTDDDHNGDPESMEMDTELGPSGHEMNQRETGAASTGGELAAMIARLLQQLQTGGNMPLRQFMRGFGEQDVVLGRDRGGRIDNGWGFGKGENGVDMQGDVVGGGGGMAGLRAVWRSSQNSSFFAWTKIAVF